MNALRHWVLNSPSMGVLSSCARVYAFVAQFVTQYGGDHFSASFLSVLNV
jgi:hypothetical protein